MPNFQIDHNSGIPIYVQLMDQIKLSIASGTLQPGNQLPTIRELAVELTVNLHTVAHAYAELEREGFLTVQRGRGTFVPELEPRAELAELRERKLQTLVETMLADALNLGYEPQEISQALAVAIDQRRRILQRAAHEASQESAAKAANSEEKGRIAHGRRAIAETVL